MFCLVSVKISVKDRYENEIDRVEQILRTVIQFNNFILFISKQEMMKKMFMTISVQSQGLWFTLSPVTIKSLRDIMK